MAHIGFPFVCTIRLMTKQAYDNHITFDVLNRYQGVVDESIKLVMKKRQVKPQVRGLTEQDLFFREVCFCTCKPICLNYHCPSCNDCTLSTCRCRTNILISRYLSVAN